MAGRSGISAGILGAALLFAGCAGGDPARGRAVFTARDCLHCHTIGQGPRRAPDSTGVWRIVGPDLSKAGRHRSESALRQWLADPDLVYDREGKRPFRPGYPPMPRQTLTTEEIRDLAAYVKSLHRR